MKLSKLLTLHFIALGFSLCAAAQNDPARRILVLNEDGPLFPAIKVIDQAIYDTLNSSPFRLEFYYEHMDNNLFPDPSDQQRIRDFYIHKYENRRPNVIVTVGPEPLQFMLETHQQAFPGVPVIFCLPNGILPSNAVTDPDFTGVESDIAPVETLEVALRLRPGTRHVIVAGGSDVYDKQTEAELKQQLLHYEHRLDFIYLTDLAMPDLLERLQHPPANSVILFTSMGRDGAGTRFIPGSESGPMIAAAANAPFFSLSDVYLNHGEVGGDVSDLAKQGRIAAGMALRILKGEKPQDIPRAQGVMTYMFDWRALKRWGLKESYLPADSIVLNRPPSFWRLYGRYVIAATMLLLLQSSVIIALLWQRRLKEKAEKSLRESEERFRRVANTAPVMIWMSGTDKLCEYFNQRWLAFTGRSLQEELGNGWVEGVHADDLQKCLGTYTERFDCRESFEMEYRLRRHDGEYRWVLDFGVPRFHQDGSFAGYIGSCIDVTDPKMAHEALEKVSGQLIEAQEKERRRLARELHDDICQRLALLSVKIQNVTKGMGGQKSVAELDQIWQECSELTSDVQSLSHELHPSGLDILGLVTTVKSFCREVSKQNGVGVEFVGKNIPNSLPREISLSLFRVIQEAIHNALKYSGEKQFEVRLEVKTREIELEVSDRGVGFDPTSIKNSGGLGLVSMAERIHQVDGTFTIDSQPNIGTRIRARVPLAPQPKVMTADAN